MAEIEAATQPTLEAAQALTSRGDLAGADAMYRALHNPAAPELGLLVGWSRVRRRGGDTEGALAMLKDAAQLGGGAIVALETASVLLDIGRADQATPLLRQAAEGGRGSALDFEVARWEFAQRRFDRAGSLFRALMKAEPRHVPARLGFARSMRAAGQLGEAEAAYVALLNRAPGHVAAARELASLYAVQRKFAEALALYDRIEASGIDVAREISQVALGMMQVCDWSQREAVLARLSARVASLQPCVMETFALLGGVDDPALHRQMGECFAGMLGQVSAARLAPAARRVGPADQRLRVGYLSGDFNQHVARLQLAGVLEAHDREKFEIFAYDYSVDDRSPARERIKSAFEHFREIGNEGPEHGAARIAADGIDILIDLKGYTERTRSEILALRAAPVQVNFLGYVATQGAAWIDYVIADDVVLPAEAYGHWTEQPVLMPASYYPNDRSRPRPAPDTDRAAHGLPADGIVFCCFSNSFKLTPAVFQVWLGLLRDVPGSVLWLYESNDRVAANLRAAAGDLAGRLCFARPATLEAHLARHGCADVFLDTLPYGAHASASDALWMGLPVVTCLGQGMAARTGASLLHAVGLPELVCGSLAAYAALARELAADAGRREAVRAHLMAARDTAPLFDAAAYARGLESAFLQMADRARRGEAASLIRV